MSSIANKITVYMARNNIIKESDCKVYSYGLEMFLLSVLEIGIILLVSVFVGNLIETLIFFASFLPIRIFSGGYHANTRSRCFGVLIFVYIVFSLILKIDIGFAIYNIASIVIPIMILLCIYRFAPIKHENKNLTDVQKKNFKKLALLFALIESVLIYYLFFVNMRNRFTTALLLGLLTALTSLIAGVIKNKFTQREV